MYEPDVRPQDENGGGLQLNLRMVLLLCVIFALSSACAAAAGGGFALLLLLTAAVSGALLCGFAFPPLLLLSGLAAYPLAWLLSGSYLSALMALAALPTAFAIGLSARAKKSCSDAVARSAALLSLLTSAALLVWLFRYAGEVSGDAVVRFSRQAYDFILAALKTEFSAVSDSSGLAISEEALAQMARYLITTMPALLICAANIASFLCAKLFAKLCRSFGLEQGLSDPRWVFDMSLISASIFIIATLMTLLLASSAAEPVYYTAANIQIILTPGLALIGLRAVLGRMMRRMARGMTLLVWLLVLGVFFFLSSLIIPMLSTAITLFSIVGAISILRRKAPRIKFQEK